MPICPFWTGLIIGPALFPGKVNVTFTNSIVKIGCELLKEYFKRRNKIKIRDFIRRMYEGILGRIKAFYFAFARISSKVLKKKKTERKSTMRKLKKFGRGTKASVVISNHVIRRIQQVLGY